MKLQEAIQKAIEGGWEPHPVMQGFKLYQVSDSYAYFSTDVEYPGREGAASYSLYIEEIMLDPLFWQSLGKSLGWKDYEAMIPQYNRIAGWLFYWHRFIDHLAEGKTIETYFETL